MAFTKGSKTGILFLFFFILIFPPNNFSGTPILDISHTVIPTIADDKVKSIRIHASLKATFTHCD